MIGAARGALAEAEAQCVASQQLGALAYLHAQGVVHLDVKPQNILCHEPMSDVAADPLDGVHTKLLDFGFARVPLLARAHCPPDERPPRSRGSALGGARPAPGRPGPPPGPPGRARKYSFL